MTARLFLILPFLVAQVIWMGAINCAASRNPSGASFAKANPTDPCGGDCCCGPDTCPCVGQSRKGDSTPPFAPLPGDSSRLTFLPAPVMDTLPPIVVTGEINMPALTTAPHFSFDSFHAYACVWLT